MITWGNYFESKTSINCLKIKLAWTDEKLRKWKAKWRPRVLPSSTWLQMLLLHVVVSRRTTKNCIKMKDARAGRAQFADVTVVLIKYADLWCPRRRCHCASFLITTQFLFALLNSHHRNINKRFLSNLGFNLVSLGIYREWTRFICWLQNFFRFCVSYRRS